MSENTIRVTGWSAENCKRADESVVLYDSRTNEPIDLERARILLHWQNNPYRSDCDRKIHADVPVVLALELALKHHDWTHEYSDDYEAYTAGRRGASRIRDLMAKMEDQELANKMFKEYRDKYGV